MPSQKDSAQKDPAPRVFDLVHRPGAPAVADEQTGRSRKRRPDTQERILTCAIRLFHQQGYGSTSIDEIGAAAGMSGPGVYRHFSGKQDIIDQAAQRGAGQVFARSDEIFESKASAGEKLQTLTEDFVSSVVDDPSFIAIFLRDLDHLSPDVLDWCQRQARRYIGEWVKVIGEIRSDLTPAEARVAVRAMFNQVLSAAEHRSGLGLDRLKTLLIGLALGGLLGERADRSP